MTSQSAAVGQQRLIIGLMAGNSLDGISAALVATSGLGTDRTMAVPAHLNYPVTREMRNRLYGFLIPATFRGDELDVAHTEFGEELALAAIAVMDAAGVESGRRLVIGVQGANLIHAIAGHEGSPTNGHMEIGELASWPKEQAASLSAISVRATSLLEEKEHPSARTLITCFCGISMVDLVRFRT